MLRYLSFLLFIFAKITYSQNSTPQSTDSHVIEINNYLKKSDDFIKSNLDSALYYSKRADILIHKMPESIEKIGVYKMLGNIYLAKGNYATSLDYYMKAISINDKLLVKSPKNHTFIKNNIELIFLYGNVDQQQGNFNKALQHYTEATNLLNNQDVINPKEVNYFHLKIINNTASIYIKQRNFKKGIVLLEKALKINETYNNKTLNASIYNNIGICHLEEKEYAIAIYYYKQALKIRQELNDKRGIAQCYNNLGKCYALIKNYTQSKSYFTNALTIGREIGNIESIVNSLESLSSLYYTTNNYKESLDYFSEMVKIKDSLFNEQSLRNVAQIEMKYALDKQKENFESDLAIKEAQNSKQRFRVYLIAALLIGILGILVLWIYLQKTKIKNIYLQKDKLELERKNLSLEHGKLKEDLAFQNREMTSKVMFILKKNELINSIGDQLVELKKNAPSQNQKQIQEMIIEMRQKKDQDVWTEFETHFTKVHPDFYSRLNQQFPDLTPNEKKLCAFLKLNLSTKEISAITYQSVNSIMVSRTRLRKKLNIQGEETNLTSFLMKL
ncbi:tetratricopeptide repeat protein [Empedobacter falsenii]|uniref:tetratricopeptide repeat protein n=1 Tax=Empedobacter falsenii TaxID=343874 RepID=UPI00056E9788|nr:tetratricopeptide repeat protein [Empedobacter falsenii]